MDVVVGGGDKEDEQEDGAAAIRELFGRCLVLVVVDFLGRCPEFFPFVVPLLSMGTFFTDERVLPSGNVSVLVITFILPSIFVDVLEPERTVFVTGVAIVLLAVVVVVVVVVLGVALLVVARFVDFGRCISVGNSSPVLS